MLLNDSKAVKNGPAFAKNLNALLPIREPTLEVVGLPLLPQQTTLGQWRSGPQKANPSPLKYRGDELEPPRAAVVWLGFGQRHYPRACWLKRQTCWLAVLFCEQLGAPGDDSIDGRFSEVVQNQLADAIGNVVATKQAPLRTLNRAKRKGKTDHVSPQARLNAFTTSCSFDVAITDGFVAVPVDALDVIVHFRRQALPPFRTTILQHFTAAFTFHTFAKTVDTHASTDFRLISSFCHYTYLPKNRGLQPQCLSSI
jgi:hypothetical protein